MREGVSAVWLLTSASSVGLVLLAEPVIALLYEGGRFTAEDTAAVAMILRAYMVGLLPYSMVKLFAPAFYSVDRPRVPLIASVSAVTVNLVFNALTYRHLGAPGLALGTSLAALVNLTILRLAFRRLTATTRGRGRGREWAALLLANAIMAAVVAAGHGAVALGLLRARPRPCSPCHPACCASALAPARSRALRLVLLYPALGLFVPHFFVSQHKGDGIWGAPSPYRSMDGRGPCQAQSRFGFAAVFVW